MFTEPFFFLSFSFFLSEPAKKKYVRKAFPTAFRDLRYFDMAKDALGGFVRPDNRISMGSKRPSLEIRRRSSFVRCN